MDRGSKLEPTIFRRIYAVPDIHGRSDLLKLLLIRLTEDGYDEAQDLLIFLGDMIDRGPDSLGVLETIKKLTLKRCTGHGEVIALRGNHEDLALKYHSTFSFDDWALWSMNGGDTTLASYNNGSAGPGNEIGEDHLKWLVQLPYLYSAQGFFFSHAPVPINEEKKLSDLGVYTSWELTWHYKNDVYFRNHEGPILFEGEALIGVCGHIHGGANRLEPRIYKNYRMLDVGCGCYPNHPLVAHECLSGRNIFALAKDL